MWHPNTKEDFIKEMDLYFPDPFFSKFPEIAYLLSVIENPIILEEDYSFVKRLLAKKWIRRPFYLYQFKNSNFIYTTEFSSSEGKLKMHILSFNTYVNQPYMIRFEDKDKKLMRPLSHEGFVFDYYTDSVDIHQLASLVKEYELN